MTKLTEIPTESPEQFYMKSESYLGVIFLFKTIFLSICSAGTENEILTTLRNSCCQKFESFSLNFENGWRIEKKHSHKTFFLQRILWHMEFSFGNPAEKIQPKKKINESKYKQDEVNFHNFQKWIISSKCSLDTQVQFLQSFRRFPTRCQEIFPQSSEPVEQC